MQAAEPVMEEEFTPRRTTRVLILLALGSALLSALIAVGVVDDITIPGWGQEFPIKNDTQRRTASIVVAGFAVVAVAVSIRCVGADLAAFKARVIRERQEETLADAQKRADAEGGVLDPEDFDARPTDPVVPAGRLALFRVVPALGVVAGIVVMIVALA